MQHTESILTSVDGTRLPQQKPGGHLRSGSADRVTHRFLRAPGKQHWGTKIGPFKNDMPTPPPDLTVVSLTHANAAQLKFWIDRVG